MNLAKFADLDLPTFSCESVIDHRQADQLPKAQHEFIRLVGFNAGKLSLSAAIDKTHAEHQRLTEIPALRRLGIAVIPFEYGLVPITEKVHRLANSNPNVLSSDLNQIPQGYLLAANVKRVHPTRDLRLISSYWRQKIETGINTFDAEGNNSSEGSWLGDIWLGQFIKGVVTDQPRPKKRYWLVDIEPRITSS